MTYRVEKLLDGFSVCFRQWNATHSHCQYLHGYAISFKLHFEASQLNQYHWVWDFGWLKNPDYQIDDMTAKAWFSYMFDHTVIVAEDDPELDTFKTLNDKGIIQLRIVGTQSCEGIAALIFNKIKPLVSSLSDNDVKLVRVDVFEHHKNCASYYEG